MFKEIADLTMEVLNAGLISPETLGEIRQLCNDAYGENLVPLFDVYTADFHVLARRHDLTVGHAMIVTRWLQAGESRPMRTAYVEMVATSPGHRRQGVATMVMREVAQVAACEGYDLAALCPADTGLYCHLGWEYWQGELFIRAPGVGGKGRPALMPTPEERVMILRLPATPALDPWQHLSAEWREGGELW